MQDNHDIELQIEEKINLAINLSEKLERDFAAVEGAIKVKRLIDKEIKFLKRLKTSYNAEKVSRQLQCTNLNFYDHLVNSLYKYVAHSITAIASVQRRNGDEKNIRVDILCDDKQEVLWIKIIARSSTSLIDGVMGRAEYGTKDILDIAEDYLEMAQESNFFRQPKIIFDFLNPIDGDLEGQLEEKGIIIGRKFGSIARDGDHQTNAPLNIDVSTMLAYVSELSNGGTNYRFSEKLLEDQAENERNEPIKPILDKIFANKRLIACETAVKSFDEIINLLGGPNEKRRAEEFKRRCEIFSDADINPHEVLNVELTSQIKERSRLIFAFGIVQEAITVSSNCGFVRAARMKNLVIPMIPHSARALTELKQREKVE